MRRLGAAAVVTLSALASPTVAGAACERDPDRARFAAERLPRAVLVCDRMLGRRRVVRAVPPNRRITDVAAAGPRVAWLEAREATIVLYTRHLLGPVQAPREIARGNFGLLAVEDGRTLRWVENGMLHFLDLRPPRLRRGCPQRERFRTVTEQDGIRVSFALYGRAPSPADIDDDRLGAWRACAVGTGTDRVVMGNHGMRLVAVGGGLVRFVDEVWSRYYGCEYAYDIAVDVATGAQTVSGPRPC